MDGAVKSESFVMLRRKREHAAEIERILGLPNDRWLDVEIKLTLDEIAVANVTLMLSPEQFKELIDLGAFATGSSND